MNEKFANVPMDSDTLLLLQADAQINGIDALYQKWIWSGVARHHTFSRGFACLTAKSVNGFFVVGSPMLPPL